jgi:hypothetical protein
MVSLAPVLHAQSIKGNYAIKNVKTGKLLRPEDANKSDLTNIVLYSPTNWKCLTWEFIALSNETYQLRNLFTSKTFSGARDPDTAEIQLKQVVLQRNEDNQSWVFEKAGGETYRIRVKNSHLYITPADSTGRTNTPVVLAEEIESDLQLWIIYEQDPVY